MQGKSIGELHGTHQGVFRAGTKGRDLGDL